MFYNAQPAEIPDDAFPADVPSDTAQPTPDEALADDPLGVPAQDPMDVPSDVPSNRSAHAEVHPHRMAIAMTGAVLLSLLTATAVFAAKDNKGDNKDPKDPKEHGQSFENAHPPKDSVEARKWKERRDAREEHEHAAAHPGKPHVGPPGHSKNHPTPPGFEGPNGKPTFTNRKMRGHKHHEDRPERTTEDAKHWQDKRMWRQEGTWQGADTWANARAKDWKAQRTTWPLRGGYGGAFITQAEYEKHYTVAHDFRIGDEPKMKNGYAHFSHEGDRFVIVDPYPENWNTKWHSSDDVYLEYNQGYYLINRQHPGSPLAIMVLE
jgi:hypothetical protein